MLIKKKSLLVAVISSTVILIVLILTLIGYLIYIELKAAEFKKRYQDSLQKILTKSYARHIEIYKLTARLERDGPLKGKPVIEGILKNKGYRAVVDILIKAKFLDEDGVILYEVLFHPQEPSLGKLSLTKVALPYLSSLSKFMLKPNESFAFKRVLSSCPPEILASFEQARPRVKQNSAWSGRIDYEILSIEFP